MTKNIELENDEEVKQQPKAHDKNRYDNVKPIKPNRDDRKWQHQPMIRYKPQMQVPAPVFNFD